MRMYDLIMKKRDGGVLTKEEIDFIISSYTKDYIPDYQMSALAMAIYFRGMTPEETANLTMAMAYSGDVMDLSAIKGIKVDKHSTGGVADTTTLVLAPMVAACGAPVAKMSGRGLGHTGGTIDKLESIPGMRVELSEEEFIDNVNKYGIAVIGQTKNLTPADKKLYALRDVTATVDSIPLIASSIMSKKIAAGADGIVLDVKVGRGAFMKDLESAKALAKLMVDIGNSVGRKTVAHVTNMDYPLGLAIGNALEIVEAVQVLKGHGSKDLLEVCMLLGSDMLQIAGVAKDDKEARAKLKEALDSGKALQKFKEFIKAQGGDERVVDDLSLLPQAKYIRPWIADRDVYIKDLMALDLGLVAMKLGAGREKKEDKIDLAVGIMLGGKVGDIVRKGEPIATIYANDEGKAEWALNEIKKYILLSDEPVERPTLIFE
ncbi:thymidine phosphorylase [Thermoanaerobacter thermohydrosulfuricus]|uniref:Pyrimidine-nucleoside phosphorylase n=3 Tax=Thermoanaerobacter TaxID=1754 RepID=I9KQH3_9THEO|nr:MULTISPECIES: pyrimidine-nucleoside phosphorylase [Thermoanaerobacter]EGD52710.1 pyrimidine-nucleoside phosphorylase [Thermoanaerobacter ethanolicus JW 200]EIV99128.1 pyrimidine-nucleoside phosphorylase [Thermoanaerobacter siderophilus SR4]EMT38296.1 pyrimidine-nucleoside phosphorylase [Thermoanaerobacter thermohydrosulfuricus WC1]SDF87175.1 thymidine phosphorylase [Thermoanaerobacter thermohydrosulfuricus]SFE33786.1 thymidine phosphorylase [Thermoanaerobacter thermohydrosulfuricus]